MFKWGPTVHSGNQVQQLRNLKHCGIHETTWSFSGQTWSLRNMALCQGGSQKLQHVLLWQQGQKNWAFFYQTLNERHHWSTNLLNCDLTSEKVCRAMWWSVLTTKQHPHREFTSGSEFKIAHLATQPGWLEGSHYKDAANPTKPADLE